MITFSLFLLYLVYACATLDWMYQFDINTREFVKWFFSDDPINTLGGKDKE